MSRRGVFLCLFLIFALCQQVEGLQLSGSYKGFLTPAGVNQELQLNLKKHWSNLNLELGMSGSSTSLESDIDFDLLLATEPASQGQLVFAKGRPYYTSPDAFRLIHKDNINNDSLLFAFFSPGIQGGFLQAVPWKNEAVVDAQFLHSALEAGPVTIRGTQLWYAGPNKEGNTQILQLDGSINGWRYLGAYGWQQNSPDLVSKASLWEVGKSGEQFKLDFSWRLIEPEFISPLAKTNKYTPNRQGWHLAGTSVIAGGEIGFKLGKQTNYLTGRKYQQQSWFATSQDKSVSLEWRIKPAPAFILRFDLAEQAYSLDLWNGTARYDWKKGAVATGLRLDFPRTIVRYEFRLGAPWQLLAVAKWDLIAKRSNHFLRLGYSNEAFTLQFELGYYDRGNLGAGFDRPPTYGISWEWKF